jgi:hypothetical protein
MREAREATGLSKDEILSIVQDLGIKNFNAKDERKRVVRQARSNQLTTAYGDVLQRDPDQGGLDHYINQMSEGRSISDIRTEMQGSDEYKSRFGDGSGGVRDTHQDPVRPSGPSQSDYDSLLSQYNSLSGQIGDADRRAQRAEDDLRRARDDFDRRFGSFRTEMESKLGGLQGRYDSEVEARKADKERFDTTLAEREADFLDQLNAQARAEADAQLRDLRAGSTATATAGPRGVVGLASGQTTASRREKGPMMDVRPEVNATDSVLDRSGPVVQLISRLRDRRPSGGGGRSPLSGGGSGNYYASRFG